MFLCWRETEDMLGYADPQAHIPDSTMGPTAGCKRVWKVAEFTVSFVCGLRHALLPDKRPIQGHHLWNFQMQSDKPTRAPSGESLKTR